MEKRHRVSPANIPCTYSKKKRAGKKNGSSDLVDLGTFRLIRRSSEGSTWPSVPLVLQGNEGFVYIRACKIIAFQPGEDEELTSSDLKLEK